MFVHGPDIDAHSKYRMPIFVHITFRNTGDDIDSANIIYLLVYYVRRACNKFL